MLLQQQKVNLMPHHHLCQTDPESNALSWGLRLCLCELLRTSLESCPLHLPQPLAEHQFDPAQFERLQQASSAQRRTTVTRIQNQPHDEVGHKKNAGGGTPLAAADRQPRVALHRVPRMACCGGGRGMA